MVFFHWLHAADSRVNFPVFPIHAAHPVLLSHLPVSNTSSATSSLPAAPLTTSTFNTNLNLHFNPISSVPLSQASACSTSSNNDISSACNNDISSACSNNINFNLTNEDMLNYYQSSRRYANKNQVFREWIVRHCPNLSQMPLQSLVSKAETLKKQKAKMSKNKNRSALQSLLSSNFTSVFSPQRKQIEGDESSNTTVSKLTKVKKSWQESVTETINLDLLSENEDLKNQIALLEAENNLMRRKVSAYQPKVINQKIKRKVLAIKKLKAKVSYLESKVKMSQKLLNAKSRKRKDCLSNCKYLANKLKRAQISATAARIKMKVAQTTTKECVKQLKNQDHTREEMRSLKQLNKSLQASVAASEYEVDVLKDEMKFINTKQGHHITAPFTNDVRKTCYYMLAKNVAISQVSPIISYVVRNLAHLDIDGLPSKSQLAVMQREAGSLSRMQVGEAVFNENNATMHTDGTTKAGHHYSGLQITTSSQTLSVGVQEVVSGTAENYFSAVQSALSECERIVSQRGNDSVKDLSKTMMVNIKNLISDKHVVETKFTELFAKARGDCLPDIIDQWADLPEDQKASLLKINKFHCGLHALANMATSCEEALRQREKEEDVEPCGLKFRSESNVYSFIKAVCNLFFKEGGGCPGDIQIYLHNRGIQKIPVQPFSGSRFNVLFYNGGGVYSCLDHVNTFLKEIVTTKNRLHTTILHQVTNAHIMSGCRALGLINKMLTGPLWRAMVQSDISILKMSNIYTSSLQSLQKWAADSHEVICGTASPFPNAEIEKDEVFVALTNANDTDDQTSQLLQKMFHALVPKWERWFAEHLPGGLYNCPSAELIEEAAHVPSTNVVSERDFAQLDRARTIAPHGNTQYYEGKILYRNNKTAEWIDSKPQNEQSELISVVRKDTAKRRGKECELKKSIIKQKVEAQKEKALVTEMKDRRKKIQKQKILMELQKDGGLWQSVDEVRSKLSSVPVRQKKSVLKTQIRARRRLLGQGDVNTSLFSFSRNKKQLTVDELLANLIQIIEASATEDTLNDTDTTTSLLIEKIKLNPSYLLNKALSHCYEDEGEETWWEGRVIRQKRRSVMFVIKYIGENEEYDLSLEDILYDISIGDLVLHVYVVYSEV